MLSQRLIPKKDGLDYLIGVAPYSAVGGAGIMLKDYPHAILMADNAMAVAKGTTRRACQGDNPTARPTSACGSPASRL